MFFASLSPAIAFGEKLERDIDGKLEAVHTLASTAICGIIHSIMGGQPLLILGVAEPTTLMYMYLYEFATKRTSIREAHFMAWAGWVCVWTGFMLIILGIFNACDLVNIFTHVAGELFSLIVAILYLQQAIKGAVYEFKVPHHENPTKIEYQFHWRFANGLFEIILALGILFSSLKLVSARSWAFGTGFMRSFMADFGIPLMFLIWTGISYSAYGKVPFGVPRRLQSPLACEEAALRSWTLVLELHKVPIHFIFAVTIPAVMMTCLFGSSTVWHLNWHNKDFNFNQFQ